jgi:hypothetical protein
MSRFTRIWLALTIINLITAALVLSGILDASRMPGFYATFPVGITCLGMFLISLAFQKETAAYDAEHADKSKALPAKPPELPREAHA